MTREEQPLRRVTGYIVPASAVLALANVLIAWPGVMTRDSFRQYGEAISGQLTDWHPPVMAWLWRWTLPVTHSGAPFLVAHCLLYWAAFALIAADLWRHRGPRWGLAIAAIAILPPFVVMNVFIWKDTGMAVSLLAAFALILHGRLGPSGRVSRGHGAVAALLLVYAVLVRANGIIAAAPLIVWWLAPRRSSPVVLAALTLVLMPVGIVAASLTNGHVFHAHASRAYNSIKVYDVAGVAHYSRDVAAYPVKPPLALVDRCYDVRQWDWIGRGDCADLLTLKVKGARPWVESIGRHPFAYAIHRLAHYNQELFAWVPYDAFRYRDSSGNLLFDQVGHSPLENAVIAAHGDLASFPLFAPVLFVILALGMLSILLVRGTAGSEVTRGGIAILAASLTYEGAFLIIGVANMWRYAFFSEAAALIGAVLVASDQAYGAGLPRFERVLVVALGVALLVVCVARGVL